MKEPDRTIVSLGSFEVVSEELVVADPCRAPGTWCMGRLKRVRPGHWNAGASIADAGAWGDRVAMLSVWHEDAPEKDELCSGEADFDVGVDSGQVGFFDAAHYRDSSVIDAAPQRSWSDGENLWYDHCCALTLSSTQAGVLPFGAVSASGFGDGGYSCLYYTNSAGEILRAEIAFITEDEWEEYGWPTTSD